MVRSETASTVPVTFGTAHDALFEFGQLKPGETVLIQGAAGGVGIACVQLAKRSGAQVIGTASDPDRLARLGPLGLEGLAARRAVAFDQRRDAGGGVEGVRVERDTEVADGLVPALQARGLTRRAYAHAQFRDNLLEF